VGVSESAGIDKWRRALVEALRADAAAASEPAPTRPQADGDRIEALAFRLGPETYAVEIGAITEIVLPRPITPLPRSPGFVRGVASLRGAVLPVVDLARRLDLPGGKVDRLCRILVLRDGEERMGFWTGEVLGVMRFTRAELESAAFASTVDPRFLGGLGYDRAGSLFALLDPAELCAFDLGEA